MSKINTNYWISASKEFHKLHSLIFAGITIALGNILGSIYIPVGINLRISSAFIIIALGSLVFGPVMGLLTGLAYDLIGFLIFPSTVFFPGYTLSIMLEFFIYGIFLYNSQLSILKIFAAKFIVNYGIHVGLDSLWSKILFGKGYYFFFAKSIIKNTIMLPIEVIILVVFLQILLPILSHKGIIPKQNKKYIPII